MEISNTAVSIKDIPKNSRLVFTGNGLIVVPSRLDGILVINGNYCEVCLEGLQGLAQGSVIINKSENTNDSEKYLEDRTEVRNHKKQDIQNEGNFMSLSEQRLKEQVKQLQKVKQQEDQRLQVECEYLQEQVNQLQERMQVERQNLQDQLKKNDERIQVERQYLQEQVKELQKTKQLEEQRLQVECQNLQEQVKELQKTKQLEEQRLQVQCQNLQGQLKKLEDAKELEELGLQAERHNHSYNLQSLDKVKQLAEKTLQQERDKHRSDLKELYDAKHLAERTLIVERQYHQDEIKHLQEAVKIQVAKQVDQQKQLLNQRAKEVSRQFVRQRKEFEKERDDFYFNQLCEHERENERIRRESQQAGEDMAMAMQIEEINNEKRRMEEQCRQRLEEAAARHRVVDQEISALIDGMGGIIHSSNNTSIPVQKRECLETSEIVGCPITLDDINKRHTPCEGNQLQSLV